MRKSLLLFALLIASPAGAASFDCGLAKSADELAVCRSRMLNDRDVKMALLYELDLHFVPMGMGGILRDEQGAWLTQRRRCGGDRSCLIAHYDRRIARLRGIIDDRVATHGPF